MFKAVLSILLFIFFARSTYADIKSMLSLKADLITYIYDNKTVVARHNAVMTHGNMRLIADEIIYFKKDKMISASGHVLFYDSNGEIYQFDDLKLDVNFDNIDAINARAEIKEVIFWSADTLKIIKEHEKKIAHGFTFSPCKLCDGKRLWQIRAQEIVLDDKKESIVMKNSTLDFLGRPILKISHFSFPSFNAKAKSGFLKPSFHLSDEMGLRIEVPYYFRIKSNIDATLSATVGLKSPALYKVEYRHLLPYGAYQIHGSILDQNHSGINEQVLGHIAIDGDFVYSEIKYGMHVNKLFDQDKAYLKKYKLSEDDILKSHAYINHQSLEKNSHYISLETLSFQDLRPESNDDYTPSALPLIRYKQVYPIKYLDTKFNVNTAAYSILTRSGDDDNRLMHDMYFSNNIFTINGYEISLKNGLYTYLHSDNYINTLNKNRINHVNMMPYSQTKIGYELLADDYHDRIIIEPMAAILLTNNKFFTQDEELLEMRKSNFFDHNRFLDWESSDLMSRVDYGVNFFLTNDISSGLNFFIGNTLYLAGNEYHAKYNYNYITSASLQLNQNTFILNKLWINQKNFHILQHEVDSLFKFQKVHLGFNYTYKKSEKRSSEFPQELAGYIDLNFHQKWWIHFDATVQMNNKKFQFTSDKIHDNVKFLQGGAGLTYKDDCLRVDFLVNRDSTRTKNLNPSTTYILKFGVPIFDHL